MTAQVSVAPRSPSPLARAIGLGSVFGKTVRDSRRAALIVAGITGVLTFFIAAAVTTQFATPESRREIGDLVRAVPPIMQGLAGKPVNVETLGGYVQYKYGGFFPLVTGLWSILALSGTLAAEARRGSLEFVAAGPVGLRRVALEKLLAHVAMLTVAMTVVLLLTWAAGAAFATLPGDEIPFSAALGYATWLLLTALAAGSVAFAIAPFLGRGAALGIAGAVMFAGFILNGYQLAIPELEPFANLTWFGWTDDHIPLAGVYNWPSLLLVGLVAVAFFVVGVEAFARRDMGSTGTLPVPGLPRALLGLRGPFGRAFSERLSTSLSWGIGIGFFGLVMASAVGSFTEQLNESGDFMIALRNLFPNIDLASAGGFLQLVFIGFGLILAGLAGASMVGGWASDETSGRLEMVLTTPLSRVRWALASGLGAYAGIGLITFLAMVGVAIGVVSAGGELAEPVLGTLAIGLYAGAAAGVGIAVGGLFGAGIAAPTVSAFVILTWLLDFLAPAFGLPDWVHQLALTSQLGQPMVGAWEPVGIVLCLALAAGGLLTGAWGFGRRDLRG